jgi:hypothetical protein
MPFYFFLKKIYFKHLRECHSEGASATEESKNFSGFFTSFRMTTTNLMNMTNLINYLIITNFQNR